MSRILLILFLLIKYSFSFEVKMVDEIEEDRMLSKENIVAKDGKIIYKPIDIKIIKPMEVTIAKKLEAKVIKSIKPNIIQPVEAKIIYPIGSKEIQEQRNIKEPQKKESKIEPKEKIFVDENNISIPNKNIDIKVEKGIELKESNKTENLEPINIE